mmetsp:Transcript_19975/g.47202  ORF Transcript_19975/g.47202 Transcript_19975/m.47202 type:complete len:217 (+) Transcript_19975:474-1124(+)
MSSTCSSPSLRRSPLRGSGGGRLAFSWTSSVTSAFSCSAAAVCSSTWAVSSCAFSVAAEASCARVSASASMALAASASLRTSSSISWFVLCSARCKGRSSSFTSSCASLALFSHLASRLFTRALFCPSMSCWRDSFCDFNFAIFVSCATDFRSFFSSALEGGCPCAAMNFRISSSSSQASATLEVALSSSGSDSDSSSSSSSISDAESGGITGSGS